MIKCDQCQGAGGPGLASRGRMRNGRSEGLIYDGGDGGKPTFVRVERSGENEREVNDGQQREEGMR